MVLLEILLALEEIPDILISIVWSLVVTVECIKGMLVPWALLKIWAAIKRCLKFEYFKFTLTLLGPIEVPIKPKF